MKVDEQFRVAKLKNDTAALDRILAWNYYGTNQNGNSRNKAQLIDLFTSFPIYSLTTDTSEVRITGDTAVVTGTQTEGNSVGVDRMLFTRVYWKGPNGWQLLSSMQYRNPNLTQLPAPSIPLVPVRPVDGGVAHLTQRLHTLEDRMATLEDRLTAIEKPRKLWFFPAK
jgi:uncharacterized protein DUF4440